MKTRSNKRKTESAAQLKSRILEALEGNGSPLDMVNRLYPGLMSSTLRRELNRNNLVIFVLEVTLEGQTFRGEGKTKKAAIVETASNVLRYHATKLGYYSDSEPPILERCNTGSDQQPQDAGNTSVNVITPGCQTDASLIITGSQEGVPLNDAESGVTVNVTESRSVVSLTITEEGQDLLEHSRKTCKVYMIIDSDGEPAEMYQGVGPRKQDAIMSCCDTALRCIDQWMEGEALTTTYWTDWTPAFRSSVSQRKRKTSEMTSSEATSGGSALDGAPDPSKPKMMKICGALKSTRLQSRGGVQTQSETSAGALSVDEHWDSGTQ